MNNGDIPAAPVMDEHHGQLYGLTKREAFAVAAMQGILSCSAAWTGESLDFSKFAVQCADDLLAELEATNER